MLNALLCTACLVACRGSMAGAAALMNVQDTQEASGALAPYLISLFTQNALNAGTAGQVGLD